MIAPGCTPWLKVAAKVDEALHGPLLEDVVATNGACLKTRPSTPLYPPDPRALISLPEVDRRLEASHASLEQDENGYEYREMLRRHKYGDDIADQFTQGWTPAEIVQAWNESRRLADLDNTLSSTSASPIAPHSSIAFTEQKHLRLHTPPSSVSQAQSPPHDHPIDNTSQYPLSEVVLEWRKRSKRMQQRKRRRSENDAETLYQHRTGPTQFIIAKRVSKTTISKQPALVRQVPLSGRHRLGRRLRSFSKT